MFGMIARDFRYLKRKETKSQAQDLNRMSDTCRSTVDQHESCDSILQR